VRMGEECMVGTLIVTVLAMACGMSACTTGCTVHARKKVYIYIVDRFIYLLRLFCDWG
jgi:hypothetical protein